MRVYTWHSNHFDIIYIMSNKSSARERFGMMFVGVSRRWRAGVDSSLAQAGLTDATWRPLVHIERSGGGISQKDLAARLDLDASTLVRLIDVLVSKSLVERRADENDRRSKLLYLTEQGKTALAPLQKSLFAAESDMLAGLTDEQIEKFSAMLEHIDANIRALHSEANKV